MSSVPAGYTLSEFPAYSRRELVVDRVIHMIGVPLAVLVAVLLLGAVAREGTGAQLVAAAVYCFGLVSVLSASAAYNMTPPSRAKARLRRIDHAMIFVMIAGSYTPFALCALPRETGTPLLVGAWVVALVGAGLRALAGNRYRLLFVGLYIAHGFMVVLVLQAVVAALSPEALGLLAGGGAVYVLGAFVHTRERWPFHNALWHVMVLVAAGLQLGAISQVLGVW